MEEKKKKTRKSVPRPNSGRRAVDGATDLVKVGVRLSKAQHEWVQANGQHALRQLIQAYMDADNANSSGVHSGQLDCDSKGALAEDEKRHWINEFKRYGIPVPKDEKKG